MEITEVKVILKEGPDKKLKAYATLTFDSSFVVRNVKIIKGTKGLFVAMPSRKMRESCPKCNYKNVVRSKYCNQCGASIQTTPIYREQESDMRQSEHRDIAHPITLECREYIQKKVLEAYEAELRRSPSPSEREIPKAPAAPPIKPPRQVSEDIDEGGDIEL